jgi:hypothetical protein
MDGAPGVCDSVKVEKQISPLRFYPRFAPRDPGLRNDKQGGAEISADGWLGLAGLGVEDEVEGAPLVFGEVDVGGGDVFI